MCGAVRFELAEAPGPALYCHCTRCRRRTGTAASVQARIDGSALRVVEGEGSVRSYRPENGYEKLFCADCGSQLFSRNPTRPRPDEHSARSLRRRPRRPSRVASVRGVRRAVGADSRRRPAALPRKQPQLTDPRDATAATAARNAEVAASLPLSDPGDAELATRGRIAPLAGPVQGPEGRTVWDPGAGGFLGRRAAAGGQPEPLAPGPAERRARPLRGARRRLPGARRGHLQHHLRGGREGLGRGRRADHGRDRARRARPRDRAPRRAPGQRGDLHPQPHRPLRRPARNRDRGGPGERHADHRARRLPRRRRSRERDRRARHGPAGGVHVRQPAAARSARARGRRASA